MWYKLPEKDPSLNPHRFISVADVLIWRSCLVDMYLVSVEMDCVFFSCDITPTEIVISHCHDYLEWRTVFLSFLVTFSDL